MDIDDDSGDDAKENSKNTSTTTTISRKSPTSNKMPTSVDNTPSSSSSLVGASTPSSSSLNEKSNSAQNRSTKANDKASDPIEMFAAKDVDLRIRYVDVSLRIAPNNYSPIHIHVTFVENIRNVIEWVCFVRISGQANYLVCFQLPTHYHWQLEMLTSEFGLLT